MSDRVGVSTSLAGPAGPWPASDVPFPVTPVFRMHPGLQRPAGSLADNIAWDAGGAASGRAVDAAVESCRLPVFAPAAGQDQAVAAACDEHLLDGARQLLLPAGEFARPQWRAGSRADQVVALRRCLQDDFVLMAHEPAAAGAGPDSLRARVLAVAMPSGWDPAAKAGLDFLAIHEPVADAERLRAATSSITALMMKQSYCRYVWTLTDSPALSAHPADQLTSLASDWTSLWFRAERQISVPLPNKVGVLFLIRVFVAPLPAVLDIASERRQLLLAALNSMSPAVMAYKGLEHYRELVREGLSPRRLN